MGFFRRRNRTGGVSTTTFMLGKDGKPRATGGRFKGQTLEDVVSSQETSYAQFEAERQKSWGAAQAAASGFKADYVPAFESALFANLHIALDRTRTFPPGGEQLAALQMLDAFGASVTNALRFYGEGWRQKHKSDHKWRQRVAEGVRRIKSEPDSLEIYERTIVPLLAFKFTEDLRSLDQNTQALVVWKIFMAALVVGPDASGEQIVEAMHESVPAFQALQRNANS